MLEASRHLGVKKGTLRRWLDRNGVDWPRYHGRKITGHVQDSIFRLYSEGLSIPQVAERVGLHRSTVGRYLRRNNLTRRQGLPAAEPAVLRLAADLYLSGLTEREVAEKMGVSQCAVWRYLNCLEVPRRRTGRHLSEDTKEEIRALVLEGLPYAAVARILGVSRHSVYKYGK